MVTKHRMLSLHSLKRYSDSYLNLQQTCHRKICVCGGGAGGNWSSYSWDLPMAWLNTLDTPAHTNAGLIRFDYT